MVLYDETSLIRLSRYAIGVPALDSRKINVLNALKNHPVLSNRLSDWLIEGYPEMFTEKDLCYAHSPDYAAGFFNSNAEKQLIAAYELINKDGSYNRWNPASAASPITDIIPNLLKTMAGTYKAGRIALDTGFCYFLGGGAHHAHYDFGHGFCPMNDTAIAVCKLRAEQFIRRAWIIDPDAHKGDGTAAIFAEDPAVITLSIHMARGWPLNSSLPPEHPSWTPSNIDIPIEAGEENQYLTRLEAGLNKLNDFSLPDIVFVLAGADPWEGDALPSTALMKLSADQLFERDGLIFRFLEDLGLPSVWLMAGGYGEGAWKIHARFLEWALLHRFKL